MSQPQWFSRVLASHRRVAIVGGPSTGKTTLAATVTDRPVFGTDDTMALPWSDVPGAVISKARELGDAWVIEGVQVARALRKGLVPDVVVVLDEAHGALTTGQAAMGKAVHTVLGEWSATNRTVPVVRGQS